MKSSEYLKTIVMNGHMINVGVDDCGQTYILEYINKEGELVTDCVGAYETDYLGYAETLFGNPKDCEFYGQDEYCQKLAHTYCGDCEKCFMCVDRDKRFLEQYGVTYNEYCDSYKNK